LGAGRLSLLQASGIYWSDWYFETMEMTAQLAELVLTDLSETKLNEEAKRQGMISMRQDGIIKAINGLTTIEEVFKATEEDIEK